MPTKDSLRESRQEAEAVEKRNQWYRDRIGVIHERVTAYDILRRIGVDIRQSSDDRPEQISCPFHGEDRRPSARVYPDDGDGPSHVWCYTCQKRWDAIDLWREFNGQMGEPLGRTLLEMEQEFGVDTPDYPEEVRRRPEPTPDQKAMQDFGAKASLVNKRLIESRRAFQYTDRFGSFLRIGVSLDNLRAKVVNGRCPPGQGSEALDRLLDSVAEVVRDCPFD